MNLDDRLTTGFFVSGSVPRSQVEDSIANALCAQLLLLSAKIRA